jgi:hypothetical protein
VRSAPLALVPEKPPNLASVEGSGIFDLLKMMPICAVALIATSDYAPHMRIIGQEE